MEYVKERRKKKNEADIDPILGNLILNLRWDPIVLFILKTSTGNDDGNFKL